MVKTDQSFDFIYEKEPEGSTFEPLTLEKVMDHSINSLLRLMYKTCKNQSQRIKDYLVQYKAALIMKRLITKFEYAEVRKNSAKIIKIQIKFMNRNWRKNNMKIVSLVYQYVRIRNLDDWLGMENSQEEDLYLTQDEIRHLNSDFNYKHYGQFYEKLEETNQLLSEEAGAVNNVAEEGVQAVIGKSGLHMGVTETNMLH